MSEKAKLPVIILILIIIISLSTYGVTFYLLQKERTKSASLEKELSDVKAKEQMAEMNLREARNTVSSLENKLSESEAKIESITTELQKEKSSRQEVMAQMQLLKTELEQQKNMKSDLEKRYSQAQEGMKTVQSQLQQLEAKKKELEVKISDLEKKNQQVELGKIVVAPEGSAAAQASVPAALEGKVLVVNKDYNFLVVNLGSKDAIAVGDTLSVFHEGAYLGDVKIEKIHEAMSAAGFVSPDLKSKVSEGDKVVLKAQK